MPTPSVLNVKDFGALGDGCNNDTQAIQDAIDALDRSGASGNTCNVDPPGWPPYASAVYFPAGLYRITAPIIIPHLRYFRIFGDAGRGGDYFVTSGTPLGSVIRQDTDDKSIFHFQPDVADRFVQGWTIERLGFSWKNQQHSPGSWEPFDRPEERPASYVDAGAVGILFGRPMTGSGRANYYHGHIADCTFRNGWRGVAIDDSYAGGILSLWNTQLERLNFLDMKGAGISLQLGGGLFEGDPSNALRNIFVDNPSIENVEPQIRLYGQACATLENIDLEGSHRRVMQVLDCNLDITKLYLEHIKIRETAGTGGYPRVLTFYGGATGSTASTWTAGSTRGRTTRLPRPSPRSSMGDRERRRASARPRSWSRA